MRKYGSKKVIYDGIVFDSKKEARRYCELKLLERAADSRRYKRRKNERLRYQAKTNALYLRNKNPRIIVRHFVCKKYKKD